jgi:TolA-binding protein
MKKVTLLVASYCILLTMAGCGGNKQSNNGTASNAPAKDTSRAGLLAAVKAVETKLNSPTFNAYNSNLAIIAYTDFAKYFPNDSMTAGFVFKAATQALTLGQNDKAISLYDMVATKYPQSRYVPQSILGEGFIYDNNMKDTAKAHAKYSELIQKFPNDSLASNARQAIKLLGMTPDEIGKYFEKMNKEKEANKKTRT